ncbi:unnamed protein product [Urochloa humidicola]
MGQPRRRGYPHGHHHRCPRPIALPAAALALLFLAVSLLSVSLPSAPPLADPRTGLGTSSSRRILRRYPTNGSGGEPDGSESGEAFIVQMHGMIEQDDLWHSKHASNFYGCSNSSAKFLDSSVTTQPERYLIVVTSGGLNQQRTGIIDAVVAARILNATLVVPKLDQTSFWKDSSKFSEIFDIDWFISFLAKDVKIIKDPPEKGGKAMKPYKMRVPRKCTPRCYLNRVLPALLKKHVIRMTKYDYRLSNKLDTELQKLRCRVNYHALKFTDPIQELGEKLIQRMRERSRYFIALHLRFEPDMLAFSGCYYGGGEKERRELSAIRRRWRTLHIRDPEKGRRQGRCPLTPEEVGLMLRALGYRSDVHIYVASGEIYGGEDTLAPLKALFPNFYTKETLTSQEELAPFLKFSSRMAAIDFIVCDESDAFVANNIGNMAKILSGRRRYFGHKRTIRPNAKQLYPLFMKRGNMSWDAFSAQVRTIQKGYMGDPMEITPGREDDQDNTARGEMIDAEPDDDSLVRQEDPELEEILSD